MFERSETCEQGRCHLGTQSVFPKRGLEAQDVGFNPREGMDAGKCIASVWHRDILNIRLDESPLERLVKEEERREAP
ncbi:hypothetical protein TNCV_1057351 [Trichonephila clavipes]|nr:hypothetical protein TNCV_1057351 [Trichonephila clavipes]